MKPKKTKKDVSDKDSRLMLFLVVLCQNFIDAAGDIVPKVSIKKTVMELAVPTESDDVSSKVPVFIVTTTDHPPSAHQPIPLKRFDPTVGTSGRNTTIAFADEEASRLSQLQMELPVEGDLADLTLGERLAVMEGNLPTADAVSDDEDLDEEGVAVEQSKRARKASAPVGVTQLPIQTTQSLTRLLSQALHSSDQPLLSSSSLRQPTPHRRS